MALTVEIANLRRFLPVTVKSFGAMLKLLFVCLAVEADCVCTCLGRLNCCMTVSTSFVDGHTRRHISYLITVLEAAPCPELQVYVGHSVASSLLQERLQVPDSDRPTGTARFGLLGRLQTCWEHLKLLESLACFAHIPLASISFRFPRSQCVIVTLGWM